MAASIPQQSRVKEQDHDQRTKLISASMVSVAVLAVLYGLVKYSLGYGQVRETIFNAVFAQWQLEDWGHCMIVPFAAGFIVYLERGKLAAIPLSGAGVGFWMLCLGFFLYWFGFKADNIYFSYAAGQLLIAALVIWFCGWEWMRILTFPWLLLIFMWPLLFLESFISFPLRLLVSHVGVVILNLIGIHSVLNGTGILSAADPLHHLALGELFAVDVALPCSGMRSLFALMMVSALYGYFTIRSAWGRLALFLLSIPFAIAGNICRIVMLTLGTKLLGVEKAIGTLDHPSFFHMLAGYIVFVVALGGMVLVAGWISPESKKRQSMSGARSASPSAEGAEQIKSNQKDRGDLY